MYHLSKHLPWVLRTAVVMPCVGSFVVGTIQGGFGATPLTIWRFPAFLMTPKLTGILQSEFYLGMGLETLQ